MSPSQKELMSFPLTYNSKPYKSIQIFNGLHMEKSRMIMGDPCHVTPYLNTLFFYFFQLSFIPICRNLALKRQKDAPLAE